MYNLDYCPVPWEWIERYDLTMDELRIAICILMELKFNYKLYVAPSEVNVFFKMSPQKIRALFQNLYNKQVLDWRIINNEKKFYFRHDPGHWLQPDRETLTDEIHH